MGPMLRIQENIPLAPLTTFGIGGPARFYVEISTDAELKEALLWARARTLPYCILGGGSNVLIPDQGLDALVIRMTSQKWNIAGPTIDADAGITLLDLIKRASVLHLGGWEKLAGIPGSLGGAVRGNAGAFGQEIGDVVEWVRAMDAITFEVREFSREECAYAYRSSYFKRFPSWIVISARVRLKKVDPADSAEEIENTIRERERRHIQNVAAAGSFFINPVAPAAIQREFEIEKGAASREGRVPAGWLIEKVGLKGATEGGAEASSMHPNYLMNRSGATATDVLTLARRIKQAVREKYGIELVEEAVVF